MRAPDELGAVDWASYWHARGGADDVPELIRALYGREQKGADHALATLWDVLLHQESVYPATVEAVPFLAHAAAHVSRLRAGLLKILAGTAGEGERPRGENEEEGRRRVAALVPALLPFLTDDDADVRRAVVRISSLATGQAVRVVLEKLAARYRADPDAWIRADALTVLTRLDPDAEAVRHRLDTALQDRTPAVLTVAALELLERSGTPHPPEAVRVLAEQADRAGPADSGPFPGVGDTWHRIERVLDEDPASSVAVAHRWIGDGNRDGNGWRRADRLAAVWRDKEDEAVELLGEALKRQQDPRCRLRILESVARWLPGTTRPLQPVLSDALLTHALSDDRWVASAAQLALGRLGDDRLLAAVTDPAAEALDALAARTGRLEHQRLALRATGSRPPSGVLATLTPESATALMFELKELLRPRRTLVPVARRLGDLGVGDAEVIVLLHEAAGPAEHPSDSDDFDDFDFDHPGFGPSDEEVAVAAAVAETRLGGSAEPAVVLLQKQLAVSAGHWRLEDAALLGPAGAPLLPLVEKFLDASYEWTRVHAAEAHWRITGDPYPVAVPVFTALAGPEPVGILALERLIEIGCAPEELRTELHHWAHSERRLAAVDPWSFASPRYDDDRLREASLALLRSL
ncbi:hypothetical protein ACWGH4_17610 [Streptomyces sp. NPDC054847]